MSFSYWHMTNLPSVASIFSIGGDCPIKLTTVASFAFNPDFSSFETKQKSKSL